MGVTPPRCSTENSSNGAHVLVTGVRIATGWAQSVAFRFVSRQSNASTAFERGIFRYAQTDASGVEVLPVYMHMEALIVKKEGRWLMVMERQLDVTDESAWDALAAVTAADVSSKQ